MALKKNRLVINGSNQISTKVLKLFLQNINFQFQSRDHFNNMDCSTFGLILAKFGLSTNKQLKRKELLCSDGSNPIWTNIMKSLFQKDQNFIIKSNKNCQKNT